MKRLSSVLVAAALCGSAFAQGGEYCYIPQAISGTGSFAFDLTVATTDGLPDTLCNFFGQDQIERDVWFAWSPSVGGTFTIATCGGTSVDTKLAVYDGLACTAPILGCVDDACGLQSSLDVVVAAGHIYLVRLGVYPGSAPGTGTMNITTPGQLAVLDTRVNPANGRTYHLLTGGSWSSAELTAMSLGGHLATIDDQAEHDWVLAQWHTVGGIDLDLWIGLNDMATEGLFAWADGTPVGYTNWDLAEPNNGAGGEDYTAMRKNNPAAFWNDLANAPTGYHANPSGVVEISGPVAVPFCFGDGSGNACPCSNNSPVGNDEGCLHSLGFGGKLTASGSPSIANDTLVLLGSQLPSAPGLYFQGTTQLSGGVSFGDGLRCAGGTIIRLGTKQAPMGTSQYPVAGDASVSVRGLCTAGDVRSYQLWFRNSASFCTSSTFNLTNGVGVTWNL